MLSVHMCTDSMASTDIMARLTLYIVSLAMSIHGKVQAWPAVLCYAGVKGSQDMMFPNPAHIAQIDGT